MRFLRYELERVDPPIEAITAEGGPVWLRVTGGDLPADVYLHLAQLEERRWICDRVIMLTPDGAPAGLSTAALRAIPLSSIIDEALLHDPRDFWSLDEETLEEHGQKLRSLGFNTGEIAIIGQASQDQLPEDLRVVSRKGPTSEQLRLFAATYKLVAASRAPIQETVRLLQSAGLTISRATANRWRTLAQHTEPPLLGGVKVEQLEVSSRPEAQDAGGWLLLKPHDVDEERRDGD